MRKSQITALAAMTCAILLAVPMTAAQQSKAKAKTKPAAMRSMWPPETVSGKIEMVDPAAKLMVVEGPGGVPFDVVVTPKTRIESGGQGIKLKDLSQRTDQQVSVQYVPERRGDIARSIRVTG
jgi:hypothetical protein